MGTVADKNIGFKGTVTSADTPTVLSRGVRYCVDAALDLQVSAGGTGDRAVTVRAGTAWGDGVQSTWNTNGVLNGAAPSGTSTRWDTVVIRRHWQPSSTPTGTATLMLLQGGTTQAISASRQTDAGVTNSDQPIALVRFKGGETTAQEIVDLRCWAGAGGGLVAREGAVLDYLNAPGTVIDIGYTRWVRSMSTSPVWLEQNLQSLNAIPWSRIAAPFTTGSLGSSAEGWTAADMSSEAIVRGDDIELDLRLRRAVGQVSAVDTNGVFTDERKVFTLSLTMAPRNTVTFTGVYRIASGDYLPCGGSIGPGGEVVIRAGVRNNNLVGHASVVCLIVTARYTR